MSNCRMNDLSPIVRENYESPEHLEADGRRYEEIDSDDVFRVIIEKLFPGFGTRTSAKG
jgi:hypothetical protein